MKILLAVTASISAYKAYDLCRGLVKLGHQVKVVLTKKAEELVVAKTFSYLGAEEIYTAESDFQYSKKILHIELARWCERLLIYPLSANTLAKLANGLADDLLSCLFLSLEKHIPVVAFPAMNPSMWNNLQVQENCRRLQLMPAFFLQTPETGVMACGEFGEGKLSPPEKVLDCFDLFTSHPDKDQASILITTGATLSPLDPVRYLTNASSGLTGFTMAKKFLQAGHRVHVIAGLYSTPRLDALSASPLFRLTRIVSAEDMLHVAEEEIFKANLFIASAAVGDIQFDYSEKKLKKEKMNQEGQLNFQKAPDILQICLKSRRKGQLFIGMAAESPLNPELMREKWRRKPVDLLIGNEVHHGLSVNNKEMRGFQQENNHYRFLEHDSHQQVSEVVAMSKNELAHFIYEWWSRKRISNL